MHGTYGTTILDARTLDCSVLSVLTIVLCVLRVFSIIEMRPRTNGSRGLHGRLVKFSRAFNVVNFSVLLAPDVMSDRGTDFTP